MKKNIAICKRFAVTAELCDAWCAAGWQVTEFSEPGELSPHRPAPDFVFDVNFHAELHAACVELGLPYIVWSFDSGVADAIRRTLIRPFRDSDYLFFFNEADVQEVSRLHKQVWHLPFSAGEDFVREPGSSPLRFEILVVMNTFHESVIACEEGFAQIMAQTADEVLRKKLLLIKKLMDETIARHADVLSEDRMISILDDLIRFCGIDPFDGGFAQKQMLCRQYGQVLSSRQRIDCVRELAESGRRITVYGDAYWREALGTLPKLEWHPPCPYPELPCLYNAAKICVNLTQIQNLASVPQRIFHLLASGAFALSNASSALESVFRKGFELETYSNWAELRELSEYYLCNEDKRIAMARRGHAEFLAKHRLAKRLDFIVAKLGVGKTDQGDR